MIDQKADPAVKDSGLIVVAQQIEHYEIAAYGWVARGRIDWGMSG